MQCIASRDAAVRIHALEPLGEHASGINVDATAAEILQYVVDYDEVGNELLATTGFEPNVDHGDEDFWIIVQAPVL